MNRAASIATLASSVLALPALAAPVPFAAQERRGRGRLGVAAIALRDGSRIEQRAHERFPLASTFKLPLVMAVLARSDRGAEQLGRIVRIDPADLVAAYSPVTTAAKGGTMTIAELCAAAISNSDNSAANLLLRTVGGPAGVTTYLRSLGDPDTRLDHYEPELNRMPPHDPRDTTTPAAMVNLLARLVRDPVLSAPAKARLFDWMRRAETGLARIRAGVPAGWTVGDKTGTTNSAGNDVAILWPRRGVPIVLAVYFAEVQAPDAQRDAAFADVARSVVRQLG
jgi:beta-lactamase class A